jgi:hypothetical protein
MRRPPGTARVEDRAAPNYAAPPRAASLAATAGDFSRGRVGSDRGRSVRSCASSVLFAIGRNVTAFASSASLTAIR